MLWQCIEEECYFHAFPRSVALGALRKESAKECREGTANCSPRVDESGTRTRSVSLQGAAATASSPGGSGSDCTADLISTVCACLFVCVSILFHHCLCWFYSHASSFTTSSCATKCLRQPGLKEGISGCLTNVYIVHTTLAYVCVCVSPHLG